MQWRTNGEINPFDVFGKNQFFGYEMHIYIVLIPINYIENYIYIK